MPPFSDVLTSCIAKAVLPRRSNIIDWAHVKDLLADELRFEDREINISLVSHNNFQPRLRQRGFDGELDLAVLILDIGSTFTDRVCEGLHRRPVAAIDQEGLTTEGLNAGRINPAELGEYLLA